MKRMIVILVSLIMLLNLVACGGGLGEKESHGQSEENESFSEQSSSEQKIEIGNVEPGLLYDANGLKIYLEGIDDDYYGPTVKLSIENSTSVPLRVENNWSSVNGHIVNGAFLSSIPAGETVEGEYTLYKQYLDLRGICELAVLENVYTVRSDIDLKLLFMTDPIVIRTSLADNHTEEKISDPLVYEDENIRVYCKGILPDALASKDVMLLIENLSGKYLHVTGGDLTRVNGTDLMCIFGAYIPPEKDHLAYVSFYNIDLEAAGIDSMENLEMNFLYGEYNPQNYEIVSEAEHVTDPVFISIN